MDASGFCDAEFRIDRGLVDEGNKQMSLLMISWALTTRLLQFYASVNLDRAAVAQLSVHALSIASNFSCESLFLIKVCVRL